MSDLATLQTRLDEAEDAYHKLQTGQAVVRIQYDAQSYTEWTRPQRAELRGYIDNLRAQIADLQNSTASKRRAILVSY